MNLADITKISLVVALASSALILMQKTNRMPYSDPWFVPIIVVLVWQTWKTY